MAKVAMAMAPALDFPRDVLLDFAPETFQIRSQDIHDFKRPNDLVWEMKGPVPLNQIRVGERFFVGGGETKYEEDGGGDPKLAEAGSSAAAVGSKRAAEDMVVSENPKKAKPSVTMMQALREMMLAMSTKDARRDAEIEYLKKEAEDRKKETSTLFSFLDLGTSPRSAAYCLAEFGIERICGILRWQVADGFGTVQNLKRAEKRFRRSFHNGFINQVDYCRAVDWEYKATGLSLAEYWEKLKLSPRNLPCLESKWTKKPAKANEKVNEELSRWLRASEADLALLIDLADDRVLQFLGIYATAVRHDRNALAHMFSVYSSQSRTRNPNGGDSFPNSLVDFQDLMMAAKEMPGVQTVDLIDLVSRFWIIRHLPLHLDGLQFFSEHKDVIRALAALFVSEVFPALVAEAIDKADEERAEQFGLTIHRHLADEVEKPGAAAEVEKPAGYLEVERAGEWFRYESGRVVKRHVKMNKCKDKVVKEFKAVEEAGWEWKRRNLVNEWVADGEAWKILLGVSD